MTIKQIAELAGVSLSTVSKVLTNAAGVSEEKRQEILHIMDELNYRPKRTRNLQNTIGCIMFIDETSNLSSSFSAVLVDSMTRTAFLADYHLTMLPYTNSFESRNELKRYIRSTNIAGLVAVLGGRRNERFFEALLESEIPHIVLPLASKGSQVNSVQVDNHGGGFSAVAHLAQLHHTKILVMGRYSREDELERLQGALDAMREFGVETSPQNILDENQFPLEMIEVQIQRRLSQRDRPTAIFCTNYLSSLRVLRVTQALPIEIPKDLSLLAFGDYDFTPFLNPPLTSVKIPVFDVGRLAVEHVISQVKNPRSSPIHITLPTELIIRQSTLAVTR